MTYNPREQATIKTYQKSIVSKYNQTQNYPVKNNNSMSSVRVSLERAKSYMNGPSLLNNSTAAASKSGSTWQDMKIQQILKDYSQGPINTTRTVNNLSSSPTTIDLRLNTTEFTCRNT